MDSTRRRRCGPVLPAWVALTLWASPALAQFGTAQTGRDVMSAGNSPESPRPIERLPIFFPPMPPPLGKPPARAAVQGASLGAPPELADYIGEFFYPALGTRLATKTLGDKLRAQLESHHTAKLALQHELRAELTRLAGIEPVARAEGLATLSRRQTPKLAELEKTAEQLRRDLVTPDNNWSALRQWHLTDKPRRGFSPLELAQVMRAYAFFQNNLLPAQRRMLREISLELAFAADNPAAAAAAQPYLFFPPEPARVLLPDNLPAGVAAKVASYQTKKSALKKELFDAVSADDGASFGFLRSSLKALADRQAPGFAELEILAEDIRRELKAVPTPREERSPLTATLDARVADLMQAYLDAQKNAAARVAAILERIKALPIQVTYRFENDGLKFAVVPAPGVRGPPGGGASVEAVRAEISVVADDYGQQLAALLNDKESIRQEIGRSLNVARRDEADRALLASVRRATQKETDAAFSDYRTAVFEPGLSPEQRRLLFDGVIARLELPLPRGELQPTYRGDSW